MTNLHVLFGFRGRISRLQWWIGTLVALGAALAAIFVGSLVVFGIYGQSTSVPETAGVVLATLVFVVYGAMIWCQLALGVKRLHDRDSSGWLMLLGFVPLVGIALFVMLGFLDGTQGPNQHGPSPKGIGGDVGDRELSSVFS